MVITSKQCFVMCMFVDYQNYTERFKRASSDNPGQIRPGSYNQYVESKCVENVP